MGLFISSFYKTHCQDVNTPLLDIREEEKPVAPRRNEVHEGKILVSLGLRA